MPYLDRGKWRGVVKFKKVRYTAAFRLKSEAIQWEATQRKCLLSGKQLSVLPVVEASTLDLFKTKYRDMYDEPEITIDIIFDHLMKEIGIPVKFQDIKTNILRYAADRKKALSPKLRIQILERDGFKCVVCGASAPEVVLHVDHIVPRSKGGMDEERNLRTLCKACNLGRSDLPYAMKL